MFYLIYRSVANVSIGKPEIIDLWEEAKKSNRSKDITGCLLYYNGEFVQYLEGDRIVVEELFEKILSDRRHSQVILLSKDHIESREFHDWSMAFEDFEGPNYRLAYLKLLVSSYFDGIDTFENLNPTTNRFWAVVKTLLTSQEVEKFK